ncbi:MAG: nicotinate-nucleotide--dimethylbenzimidazole phosphoribosyltransferase, partial [Clostridiales bacterium]
NEKAHIKMLEYMDVKPLLHLDMRLGEGTGAALAMPLIDAAAAILNKMLTFAQANVTPAK